MMKTCLKLLGKLLIAALAFFAVTFTIYFFNSVRRPKVAPTVCLLLRLAAGAGLPPLQGEVSPEPATVTEGFLSPPPCIPFFLKLLLILPAGTDILFL